jgi:hypothetical protein
MEQRREKELQQQREAVKPTDAVLDYSFYFLWKLDPAGHPRTMACRRFVD